MAPASREATLPSLHVPPSEPSSARVDTSVQVTTPVNMGAASRAPGDQYEQEGTPTETDADALSILYRVDCSPILDEDDQLVAIFQDPRVKMDVAPDQTLLIGFQSALFVAQKPAPPRKEEDASTALASLLLIHGGEDQRVLNTSDQDEEGGDEETVTDVKWLDNERMAVSYASGIFRIFNRQGRLQLEQKFQHAAIVKLDVSASVSTKVNAAGVQRVEIPSRSNSSDSAASTDQDTAASSSSSSSSSSSGSALDGEVWILYDDSTVVIIQLQELLLRMRSAVAGPAQANKFRKYALRDQAELVAVAPCGPARPTIFQSHPRLGVHTVVSIGASPFLSFVHAGNDQNSIIHMAHIATAIASRAAGAVWSFATSWGWASAAPPTAATSNALASSSTVGNAVNTVEMSPHANAETSGELLAVDAAAEHVPAPLSNRVRAIPEDPRRRGRVLVLSPTGRLAAISDTLGRVLLVDTYRMTILRMWKGYRYAQCGWMHGAEGRKRPQGLYLVIYSAQRGIVEVWRARYGPRVYSFAVGDRARLFTRYDAPQPNQPRRIRCMVLTTGSSTDTNGTAGNDGMVELIELQAHAPSAPILIKYFTQNKLQEENFLLHQIIGGLQAFARKKRADVSHTLEQDSINPLLDDIATLAAPTSIETLLDVLLGPEMTILSATFVLKAFERLLTALRNGLASHSPTGAELSLMWQLQWRQRILSAFIGLHAEFHRASHLLTKALNDNSLPLAAKQVAPSGDDESALARLMPWLELYRRAGFNWSDDGGDAARQAAVRAMRLTWWEFMEYFSIPFMDADLPKRRDILALYEHSETSEAFLRSVFREMEIPILRSSVQTPERSILLTFLFTPVLSNVFAVQELAGLHETLFLTPARNAPLFVDWYFSLPVGAVLAITAPSASSPFQRWIGPYIGTWDYEADMEQDARDFEFYDDEEDGDDRIAGEQPHVSKRRLASCSIPLALIFRTCVQSQRLVHSFILSEHCRWGELQVSQALEENTLGKYSSVDGGLRWCILHDCISQAVHLSLRLGRPGKVAVETVENIDDILRSVALMQLNDGHDLDDFDFPGKSDQHGNGGNPLIAVHRSRKQDDWVVSLEESRNAMQMKNWIAVVQWFPRFADKDTLYCFRVSVLCAAWNAERSEMHQLEDAVTELQSVGVARLRVAMGIHIWETYLRIHVVTLISFWEESANGRKPQRGLQPQVARRFFGIIQSLLRLIISSVQTHESEAKKAVHGQVSNEYDYYRNEDDSDGGEGGYAEDDDDDENEGNSHRQGGRGNGAAFSMENLASRKRWSCRVRDLRIKYAECWPPPHDASALMKSLADFPVERVCRPHLADHLSLVLLLDSFAATSVSPVSIVKLFSSNGRHLCRPESFLVVAENGTADGGSTTPRQKQAIHQERTNLLRQLLRHDQALGFTLAEAFELPIELIRKEHVLFLFQSGRDELAEFSLDQMKHPEQVVHQLGSIARARLALILTRMKTESEFAMLMGVLPADVFAWVTSSKTPPLVADPMVERLDEAPSLTSTSLLLQRCLAMIAPAGPEFDKMNAMSLLAKDIISRVKHHQQHQPAP